MDCTRIYLDTNVLLESRWPNVSVALENLFLFAGIYKVEVCISEAVEREVEEHWIRAINDERHRVKERLIPILEQVEALKATVEIPCEAELRKKHKEVAALTKSSYGVLNTPLTTRAVDWFFQRAIEHTPPFLNKGTNFQDFVILMSVIDHLIQSPTQFPVLLTSDKGFKGADIAARAREAGVSLKVAKLDEIYKSFQAEAEKASTEEKLQKRNALWERLKSSATEQLKAFYPEIEGLIILHLNERGMTDLGYQLVELKSLTVLGIKSVDLPLPDLDVHVTGIFLTATVRAKYLATMKPMGIGLAYRDEVVFPGAEFQAEKEDEFKITARATVAGEDISDIHDLYIGQ